MITVSILGSGNVATHLYRAFAESTEVQLVQIYGRNPTNLLAFKDKVSTCSRLEDLKKVDIFILAVKDDAVEEIIQKLKHRDAIIAHTSGSIPLSQSAKKNGVFYPLQTFSKDTPVDFKHIPLCLEASDKEIYTLLEKLALSISPKVFSISSEQRKSLHLSAVFVCNFVNHLYHIGESLCEKNEVPFEILHALILETARKASLHSPKAVQTGPAVRNDQKSIATHLERLTDEKYKEIYTLLTQSIQATYGTKL
ncbi:Rossmann-like and DUF2520 domain-containing protein [Mesonia ostreae]|uniref:DUF2520 domain-containing protein n=1 Tax=Mesonia ostreae TaxID=861110 RepID=A0ABU2KJS9_9FLAO|nr:Rossmann-like and DUF2520 domain-containing protein [Mesonia ostreae]MDT0294980.1 DUF2520 domain-containing protein [Mesonia ostreae]